MERFISSAWGVVLIGVGCWILSRWYRAWKTQPTETASDLYFNQVYRNPAIGAAVIVLGAYVVSRDVAEWLF